MEQTAAAQAARILIADDDPAARRMLVTALSRVGYVVEEAADGDAALASLERNCPDVLIADLVMPGINGQELATRAKDTCKRMILIFMSGYTPRQLHQLDITQVVYLEKPVSIFELRSRLERLLAARGA